jgi:hypothetical protein
MDTTGGPYKTEFVDGVFRSYHNHSKEDAPKYGARLRDAVMTPVNWPTVTATEARQGFQDRSRGMKGSQESLSTVVVKSGLAAPDNLNTSGSRPESWATPAARDWKGQSSSPGYQKVDLNDQIKAWSTPNAFCFQPPENTEQWQKRATMQQEKGVNLHKPVQSQVLHENEKVVGAMPPSAMKLNPRWVETLMGLPVGWVMPSCQNPITPKSEPTQESPLPATGNWPTASTMDVITPTRDLTQMESKGHWGKQPRQRPDGIGFIAPNTGKLSEMVHYTSPVTIEPTSCASLETELSRPPQNSPSELFGRN